MPVSTFRLILDDPATSEPLEVPPGVCYLTASAALTTEKLTEPACLLEPVRDGNRERLLMLCPSGLRPRVNGQPAPRVALLSVKDQVQFGETVLHVTQFHQPPVGPPPDDVLGRDCPLCRTPVEATTTVYVCPTCRTALHAEGEGGLDCVRVGSECPVCAHALVLQSGYAYMPER